VPQGGKTGTHQSYLDAWFVGFTAQYSTAVWVGYESQQVPLEDVTINGQYYSRVFGGSVPAPIWAEFMAYVQKDLPVANFPEDPPNLQEYMVPPKTNVPSVIGLTAEEAESRLRSAKLNVTIEEINSPEPEGIVVNQSVEPGATVNQGTYVTIYVSTGKPPVGDLPNLLGLTVEEALAVIDDFELETGLQINFFQQKKATNKKNEIGKILDMDPPPGTSVTGSVQITLVVGEAKK
jgi:hypothetical protein